MAKFRPILTYLGPGHPLNLFRLAHISIWLMVFLHKNWMLSPSWYFFGWLNHHETQRHFCEQKMIAVPCKVRLAATCIAWFQWNCLEASVTDSLVKVWRNSGTQPVLYQRMGNRCFVWRSTAWAMDKKIHPLISHLDLGQRDARTGPSVGDMYRLLTHK